MLGLTSKEIAQIKGTPGYLDQSKACRTAGKTECELVNHEDLPFAQWKAGCNKI
jgi:hypothetical protein